MFSFPFWRTQWPKWKSEGKRSWVLSLRKQPSFSSCAIQFLSLDNFYHINMKDCLHTESAEFFQKTTPTEAKHIVTTWTFLGPEKSTPKINWYRIENVTLHIWLGLISNHCCVTNHTRDDGESCCLSTKATHCHVLLISRDSVNWKNRPCKCLHLFYLWTQERIP